MAKKLKLQKIGGNLMITVQKVLADAKQWAQGDEFVVTDNGKDSIIITKVEE